MVDALRDEFMIGTTHGCQCVTLLLRYQCHHHRHPCYPLFTLTDRHHPQHGMPFLQGLVDSGNALMYSAYAHPPTVTLPRIKVRFHALCAPERVRCADGVSHRPGHHHRWNSRISRRCDELQLSRARAGQHHQAAAPFWEAHALLWGRDVAEDVSRHL